MSGNRRLSNIKIIMKMSLDKHDVDFGETWRVIGKAIESEEIRFNFIIKEKKMYIESKTLDIHGDNFARLSSATR